MAQPAAAAALGEQSSGPAGVCRTLTSCGASNTLCSSLLTPAGQLFLRFNSPAGLWTGITHLEKAGHMWNAVSQGQACRLQHLCRHGVLLKQAYPSELWQCHLSACRPRMH